MELQPVIQITVSRTHDLDTGTRTQYIHISITGLDPDRVQETQRALIFSSLLSAEMFNSRLEGNLIPESYSSSHNVGMYINDGELTLDDLPIEKSCILPLEVSPE